MQRVVIVAGSRVDKCVENMCHKGCKALWADIEALQNGLELPEVESLSAVERGEVLVELRAIMAVYASTGSCAAE